MSNLVPMSGNIAIALYECDGRNTTKNSNQTAKPKSRQNVDGQTPRVRKPLKRSIYKIQVLVNEVAVSLPCCNGETVCSLTRFVRCYHDLISKCNFDKICKIPRKGKGKGRKKGKKKAKRKNKKKKYENEEDY